METAGKNARVTINSLHGVAHRDFIRVGDSVKELNNLLREIEEETYKEKIRKRENIVEKNIDPKR